MKLKTQLLRSCIIALALGITGGAFAADQRNKPATDRNTPTIPVAEPARTTTGQPEKANKASGLIGMNVRNQSDEKLGDIKDVVVDLHSGKASYAVLDSGGIFQDKLFAVPLSAFTISGDRNHLVLNANKSRMETAKGFDKNAWPNVSNPDFGADTFWEKKTTTIELPDVKVTVNGQPESGRPEKINKASGLIGMAVKNPSNEKLGDIKDLVMDLNSGKVAYAVLDAGGLINDKLFAVPLSAFTASTDRDHLVLNTTKDRLDAGKGFDRNTWPAVSNPDFGAERFWDKNPSELRPEQRKEPRVIQ